MMIIPITLIAGAIYLFYKQEEDRKKLQVCRVKDNSLNILNERLARREITEEEYYRIKSTLN